MISSLSLTAAPHHCHPMCNAGPCSVLFSYEGIDFVHACGPYQSLPSELLVGAASLATAFGLSGNFIYYRPSTTTQPTTAQLGEWMGRCWGKSYH
jgi:hypothetical protein